MCQVWLKMALWFWRRTFFKLVDVFSLLCNYLPLEKAEPFIWTILMHCAKFGWNWPSGFGEDFLNLSMYFRNFVIISVWKRMEPFIWTNLNFLLPRMPCAKFGWNWPSGSGEEDENVKSLRQPQWQQQQHNKGQQTTDDQKSSLQS